MNYAIDHCEPFDGKKENIWMKAEHVGRYLFAVDFFRAVGAHKVIDAACAEGFGSALLAESGLSVCGADINETYLRHAKQRCNGIFTRCDLERDALPEAFHGADGATCFETVEHLDDAGNLLAGLHEALAAGGWLLLSFPNAAFEKVDENGVNYDPYHKRIYTPEEMSAIVSRAGFAFEGEYGQCACNDFYAKERAAVKSGGMTQEEADSLFDYDKASIIAMSRLIGYPDTVRTRDGYSIIWVLKRI